MIIKVTKECSPMEASVCTGGEYAVSGVEIFIDQNLDIRTQRLNVIHAVLECYFPSIIHDKIDELTQLIADGLDEL
tara:strand:- start:352 stop:579 length:228 start_codon:yes stop_codon:yes gene_type:complete